MADWIELKRLAEESKSKGEWYDAKSIDVFPEFHVDQDFMLACAPDAILALISELDEKDGVLRSLACQLSAGGYNAPEVDAKVFHDKITWGIDALVKPIAEERDQVRAEVEALRKDAGRYRALREMNWRHGPLAVAADPYSRIKLGSDCPSRDRLDEAIDAAMSKEKGNGEV